jgi:minor extracellular protease Epr
MKPRRHSDRWASAALLASLSYTGWAQPALVPVDKVERAVSAVTRSQQQAETAQRRVETAQQQVEATQRAVERAGHRTEAATRAQTAQQHVEAAQRTAQGAERRAASAQQHVAAAENRLSRLPEPSARAVAAQEQASRGNGRAEQAGRANERAELASHGRAGGNSPPSRAGPPGDSGNPAFAGKPEHSKEKKAKHRPSAAAAKPSNKASRRAARAEERARGPKEQDPAEAAAQHRALADAHVQRFTQLLRIYPRNLEMTRLGVAVRGEVVGVELTPAALAVARKAGFVIVSQEVIEGLDLRFVTLRTPRGMSVDAALARLAKIAPRAEFVANHIHIQSTAMAGSPPSSGAALAAGRVEGAAFLGIIDGGVARHASLRAPVEQRGFAQGAPAVSSHATAVASLAVRAGRFKGASLLVADVYGRDPSGGNAMALVRALGWMVARKVPVVAMPLAGPPNALVAKAIVRARQRGLYVIAPVGNGGPAAPASYPAAYPMVVAVTGVDRHNRVLIEAGRGPRIDYAAPGADMVAASPVGGLHPVRGTSFAVPLVAGRLAVAARSSEQPITTLDKEAADLGAPGPDRVYGRGLVCARCRNK